VLQAFGAAEPGASRFEMLRTILREKHVTFQLTRSWKRSTDPAFEDKAARAMALYRTCPSNGVAVCFDEFGPISLQPYPGHWLRRCSRSRCCQLRLRSIFRANSENNSRMIRRAQLVVMPPAMRASTW
jgi:hypothetical protein